MLIGRSLLSVLAQTHPVDAISLAVDNTRKGAAENRNDAVRGVATEWTAFLDDDDTWGPDHIQDLAACAADTGADLVYPWFHLPVGADPFPQYFGEPFDPTALDHQNFIPITVLVKTQLLWDAGLFKPKGPPENPCEDWGMWLALRDAGAEIVHYPVRTWTWNWHGGNTSGRADAW
jgi:glycosyltransferase involved in cell wall biosynthesis